MAEPAPAPADQGSDQQPAAAPDPYAQLAAGQELAKHQDAVLAPMKANRRELELKWDRNYRDYRRLYVPEADRGRKAWNHEQSPFMRDDDPELFTDTQSTIVHDGSRQKAVGAQAIVADIRLRGGKLPFVLSDNSLPSEDEIERIRAGADETAKQTVEASIAGVEEHSQLMHRQLDEAGTIPIVERAYLSGSVYGEMYLKRYVARQPRPSFKIIGGGLVQYEENERMVLMLENKSVWEMYRDFAVPLDRSPVVGEACRITASELREFLGDPLSIDANIKAVLAQVKPDAGTTGKSEDAEGPTDRPDQQTGRVIKFAETWGLHSLRQVEKFERDLARARGDEIPEPTLEGEDEGESGELVECMIATANGIVVRFARTKKRDRPYYHALWEEIIDGIGGQGVCDNVEVQQHVITQTLRAIEDTASIISKIILAGKRHNLQTDFKKVRFGMFLDLDAEAKNVGDAIHQLKIDGDIEGLLAIVELFRRLMDEAALMPRSEMGMDAEQTQTMFEFTERLKRAGKYLGGVNRRIDGMEQAFLADLLRWNMLDPDCPAPKGNYAVRSVGYSTFQNLYQRAQILMAMLDRVLESDELKQMSKLRYLVGEAYKSQDIDPALALKSAKELNTEADALVAEAAAQQTAQASAASSGQPPNELQQAEIARKLADAERLRALARAAEAQAAATSSKALIERADAAARLSPPAAAVPASAPVPSPVPVSAAPPAALPPSMS